jgi:4-diphosphocytidyl-2-C-methyl-D-erythritol kinase
VPSLGLLAPAKINLWLEVLGKRADGYHELSTLMLPVGVYDRVEISLTPRGISMECSDPDLPTDSANLAWQAADCYLRAAGMKTGVHITLEKQIPVGAGLGGGSSNAGAVLGILDQLLAHPLSSPRLHTVARRLGADVPFFLRPRAVLATGIGEQLRVVSGLPSYPLLLIKPPVFVGTAGIYGRLALTRGESRINMENFMECPWNVQPFMENDLESVTARDCPVIAQIKQWLLENGAIGALMTGSGPTVFGVFGHIENAQTAEVEARKAWPTCWVQCTTVLQDGPKMGM